MLLVIIGVSCVIALIGYKLAQGYDLDGFGVVMLILAIIGMVISMTCGVFMIDNIVGVKVIDDKIAMYQEENTKIENDISGVIANYLEHEKDIFEDSSDGSVLELVMCYPELKSDSLIQRQIDIYVDNNSKIKSMREEKINASVYRWWLYFGG